MSAVDPVHFLLLRARRAAGFVSAKYSSFLVPTQALDSAKQKLVRQKLLQVRQSICPSKPPINYIQSCFIPVPSHDARQVCTARSTYVCSSGSIYSLLYFGGRFTWTASYLFAKYSQN